MHRSASLAALVLFAGACAAAPGAREGGGDADASGSGTDGGSFDGSMSADTSVARPDAGPGGDARVDGGWACGEEVCGGGLDEDCDGLVDEGCACAPGDKLECFSGNPALRLVGACRDGLADCRGDFEFGTWAECEGEVRESTELCEGAVDEDCDGLIDEGCECVVGETRDCGSDVGICETGLETCDMAGRWGTCVGGVEPMMEVCDGLLDENCNGAVDEGCECTPGSSRTCGTGVGACVEGTQACSPTGTWDGCVGAVGPDTETCNGLDDDCDGTTDESLTRTCGTTNLGICAYGTETCAAGSWGACAGGIEPGTELCDGMDDEDCDGMTDEGCDCVTGSTQTCGSSTGACVAGLETCDGVGRWGMCVGAMGPGAESCNGLDDDCDGMIDEGLTRTCGSTVGACAAGAEACTAGAWGLCLGGIGPASEICNGVDDDCNGTVDDGLMRSCGTDVGACMSGMETCGAGSWGICAGSLGPSAEICDGLIDENCDGTVDEGCACVTGSSRACGSDVGECVSGVETCFGGAWDGTCVGEIGPSPELCDGFNDEDCDGLVDEGCACSLGDTRPCGSSIGACVPGIESCDSTGTWDVCIGGVGPAAEVCNLIDDDCDGTIDEGSSPPAPPIVLTSTNNQMMPVTACSAWESSFDFTLETGRTYVIEFYDASRGVWMTVDIATECTTSGTTVSCSRDDISSGISHRWRVAVVDPCYGVGPYTETTPFDATGATVYDGLSTFIDDSAGINNTWEVEFICPDPWPVEPYTVGNIFSGPFSVCSAPVSGSAAPCAGTIGPTNQAFFTATKVIRLESPSGGRIFRWNAAGADSQHLDIFTSGTEPAAGPPGDVGSIVSRQYCVASSDSFGCTPSDTSTFYLANGCYVMRNTVVDSTNGSCVDLDTELQPCGDSPCVLSNPAVNAVTANTCGQPVVSWTGYPACDGSTLNFDIQWGTDPTFSSTDGSASTGSLSYAGIGGYATGTTVYYRVRETRSGCSSSSWTSSSFVFPAPVGSGEDLDMSSSTSVTVSGPQDSTLASIGCGSCGDDTIIRWVAPAGMTSIDVTTDTGRTNFDTVLAMYDGSPICGAGSTNLGCNDDGGSGLNSLLTGIAVVPGQEYFFVICEYGAAGGWSAGSSRAELVISAAGSGATCGDGACSGGENCASCPGDCGVCPTVCGNGTCESGEDCMTCAGDCLSRTTGSMSDRYCCGNGTLESAEGTGAICDGNP